MKYTKKLMILNMFLTTFLFSCDGNGTDYQSNETLPDTGGFLEVNCPSGYLCPPEDKAPYCADGMKVSPAGLCSFFCSEKTGCLKLYESECISEYMCGTPCDSEQDCYDAGYGSWASCWKVSEQISVCADR